METKLTCYIIDDQQDSIERLAYLLEKCDDIHIIGNNSNPESGIEEIKNLKPEIVFVDVEMPKISGFEVIEEIRSQGFFPKFIFTTGYSQYAIKAIKAQAFDYLLKPIDLDELKQTLSRNSEIQKPEFQYKDLLLTKREKEILDFVLKGLTSQQIADKLFVSKNTVDTHRRNILEKNKFRTTQELILGLNKKN